MKCNSCGAEISPNARFCDQCGSPVVHDEVTDQPVFEELDVDLVDENGELTEDAAADDPYSVDADESAYLDGDDAEDDYDDFGDDDLPASESSLDDDDFESPAGVDLPAAKPLEKPLGVGAVPFVPVAPAPRAMPRAVRASRVYGQHPGFSPAQPASGAPKRVSSLDGFAQRVSDAARPMGEAVAGVASTPAETQGSTEQIAATHGPAAAAASVADREERLRREQERRERDAARREVRERERRERAAARDAERAEARERAAARKAASASSAAASAAPAVADPNATSVIDRKAVSAVQAPADPDATGNLGRIRTDARAAAVGPRVNTAAASAPTRNGSASEVVDTRRFLPVVIVVVVIALVAGGLGLSGFLGGSKSSGSDSKQEQQTDQSSQSEQADEKSETEETGPEVRSNVAAYSWSELSEISKLIAAAESDEAGASIAKKYNLLDASGRLDGTQTKDVELTDGTIVTMRIAGFRNDDLTDGSGKAGISFIAKNSIGAYYINDGTDGGWADSYLRGWLNGDFISELPSDLSENIAEVSKLTSATGSSKSKTVSDKVWIPSFSEIVGNLASGVKRADVYSSEGKQYQLFSDSGVEYSGGYDILGLRSSSTGYWWTRTVDPLDDTHYMCVNSSGEPWYGQKPLTENDILIGFCI